MKRLLILTVLVPIALILGCQSATTPTQPDGNLDVVEIPANLQDLVDSMQVGQPELDDILVDPNLSPPILSDTNYDFYAVTFIWGRLPMAPAFDGPAINWAGSMYVNGVAKGEVLKTIDFEPGQDSLVEPPDLHLIAWESVTTYHVDGLATLIALDRNVVYIQPPWLTFDTGPIKIELGFDKLEYLNAFYHVDENNGVIVIARRLTPYDCPHGTFEGTWSRSEDDWRVGHFDGVWNLPDGEPYGLMSGRFWPDTNRFYNGLFEGELSGYNTDEVKAKLKGAYYYDDMRECVICGDAHGVIKGMVFDMEGYPIGRIYGEFGDWTTPSPQVMPLRGKWEVRCINARGFSIDD